MLMLNEKEGLPIELEWFHHQIQKPNFPECTNYPNLKVELNMFEKYPSQVLSCKKL